MDMGMRDWILVLGCLLVLGVLAHGLWVSWRARRDELQFRYERHGADPGEGDEDIGRLKAELPSGGARVRGAPAPGGRRQGSLDLAGKEGPALDPIDQDVQAQNVTAPESAPSGRRHEAHPQQSAGEDAERPFGGRAPEPVGASATPAEPDTVAPREEPLVASEPIARRTRGERSTSARGSRAARGRRPSRKSERAPARENDEAAPTEIEDVLVINVFAPEGRQFGGEAIVEAVNRRGLRFGDMNIFHRYRPDASGREHIEFSMASAVEPGSFDLGALDQLRTPGVTFFLQLPGPERCLDAFEDMVTSARHVADELGGELKDERHSDMTHQTVEHCRQRVHEFARRQMSRRTDRA